MIPELLGTLQGRKLHISTIPARSATYADMPQLHSSVLDRLKQAGIEKLYAHQAEAINLALQGENLMVTTGTGSGKSLCYNIPVLASLASEPMARALYIFPTKALAQDQLGKVSALVGDDKNLAATYDGDTPKAHRNTIRKHAQIILTNPDMLHMATLPNHQTWGRFLRALRYIVLDEAHVYRGVFGGHVAWIMRRLLRLCEWYGQRPQIILCSATVTDPETLFLRLTGKSCAVISKDASPQGQKNIVLVSPPDQELAKPPSPNVETAMLLADAAKEGAKAIAFCRSRTTTELVVRTARQKLESLSSSPDLVESYRGGYTPKQRRQIEKKLFRGKIKGLAATNAMELGVDIGGLDLAILNGYLGRIASFWQQMGRAGRAGRDSLGIMISHSDPLEAYLADHPDLLLGQASEPSIPAFSNRYIQERQILCAAYERPIAEAEVETWQCTETALELQNRGELALAEGRYYYPSHDPPAPKVNIRGTGGGQVSLVVSEEELGVMETARALRQAHKGAIYLHQGQTYQVQELDLDRRKAYLEPCDEPYYTLAVVQSTIEKQVEISAIERDLFTISLQSVLVTSTIPAYHKIDLSSQAFLGELPLDLPPETFETIAFRINFDQTYLATDSVAAIGAMHALEHLLTSIAPLVAGCDRRDLGSYWTAMSADSLSPCIAIYDAFAGGIGLSQELMDHVEYLLQSALDLVESCPCQAGCPLCLLSPSCESGNELLDKPGVIVLLRTLLKHL